MTDAQAARVVVTMIDGDEYGMAMRMMVMTTMMAIVMMAMLMMKVITMMIVSKTMMTTRRCRG